MAADPNKAVVVLSGGMDSATALYHVLKLGHDVEAVSFDYGQRHRKELLSAKKIIEKANKDFSKDIPHKVIDISTLQKVFGATSQTDPEVQVPEGHFEDESMKATVVPNRNMILMSIALAHAANVGASKVVFGGHAGDHAIYPDCRPAFTDAMREVAQTCHFEPLDVWAPFVRMDKAAVVTLGAGHKVPYELTWSCYKGGERHCGKCGTCVERKEAFKNSFVPDPTVYED
jgi:7-cyano-7-deazaguanine synthase